MDLQGRLAGAPISWGVCEVPGWGHMMSRERVLAEMVELGLSATEMGSEGYLPTTPEALSAVLPPDLPAIGGFVPLVLHDDADDRFGMTESLATAATYAELGITYYVGCPVMDADWGQPRPLDDDEWARLTSSLDRLAAACDDLGVEFVLHPHAGTVLEFVADVERALWATSVQLCLDTGHLSIGGADVVGLAERYADRIGLMHLKDVDMTVGKRLAAYELSIMEAVKQGAFPSLGDGDVDIAGVVRTVEAAGYTGWYVLETDVCIDSDPAPGEGPIQMVRRSIDYLATI